MNKTELIAAVAEKADLSKKDAEAAVTAAIDAITAALSQQEKVQLVGFGSFEVKTRAERVGRNPKIKMPTDLIPGESPLAGLWTATFLLCPYLVGGEGRRESELWSLSLLAFSVAMLCLTLCNPMDCSPPGSSVHEIFQVRVLEWVAISSSRGSS